jgi:hypothetical protein
MGGSSSGGQNPDLSAGAGRGSKFLPQIVNYEDLSKKSMQKRINSSKNIGRNIESSSGHMSVEDLKLPPINKRNYMIFGTMQ